MKFASNKPVQNTRQEAPDSPTRDAMEEMTVKARRFAVLLAAFLFILAGCRKSAPGGQVSDSAQTAPLLHRIDKVEMTRLPDALAGIAMLDADKRFIAANVHTGVYGFVSVKTYVEDVSQILEIDEFNDDEWTRSVTGERGKSPHGTRTIFKKVDGDWETGEVINYGG